MTNQTIDQLIQSTLAQLDTATVIDRARNSLRIPPVEVDGNTVEIKDAVEAALVNELLAKADDIARTVKALTGDREAIKELLEELLGDREVLKVHNAEVFTYKTVTSRVLNQSVVKSRFPDIAGNEDLYEDRKSRRALFV